jgi:hypothetical protein
VGVVKHKGGKGMKKFFAWVFIVCILILGGIADGIESGAPLSLAWWFIPTVLVMLVSAKLSD